MKKHSKSELSLPILLLIGSGAMVGGVAISAFIFALISSLTKDPTALTGILSLVSLLFAGALTSFILTRVIRRDGGMLIAIVSATITGLLMSVIGLIMEGGSVNLNVFLNYLAFIGISGLFAFLAGKTNTKKRKYR